ncbi:MAG: hypothetical protein WEB62_02170, partial [Bacteroidota bacterium]
MRRTLPLFILLLVTISPLIAQVPPQAVTLELKTPPVILTGVDFTLEVVAKDAGGNVLTSFNESATVLGIARISEAGGEPTSVRFSDGVLKIDDAIISDAGSHTISISPLLPDGQTSSLQGTATVRVIPGILSVLPPLLAIVLALVLRQVVISLFAGIWLGAIFLFDYNIIGGIYRVLDHFIIKALSETSHIQIILFSMLFGGMVGIISKNGGTVGIANVITRYAKTPRGGQLAAWGMAFVIFFDDYANCLVRGNLMRPITDKLRISREKLSFIVDAGAATVASVMIISTWIGYEVGLIEQGLKMIGSTEDAYAVFLQTIP